MKRETPRAADRIFMWKETYKYEKRSTYMKRDLQIWNEIHERGLHICEETYTYEKRPTYMKRDIQIWTETYVYEKRPTCMKRDLHRWNAIRQRLLIALLFEKRPTNMKRDLHKWKETYIDEIRFANGCWSHRYMNQCDMTHVYSTGPICMRCVCRV